MNDLLYQKFVRLGAEFCANLFGANEKFYLANQLIEGIIITGRPPQIDELGKISQNLEISSEYLQRAATAACKFVDFSNNYPNQKNFLDSSSIKNLLKIASSSCITAANLIRKFNSSDDLQEQIWAEEDLSLALMGAAESLCKATLWQIEGARESHA